MWNNGRGWLIGRGNVIHCLDFLCPLAFLPCKVMNATAFLSSVLPSFGTGSGLNAFSMGNQAS